MRSTRASRSRSSTYDLNFVFIAEDVESALQPGVCGEQGPDARADRIESEIRFAAEFQQYGFAAHFLEQDIVGGLGLV